MAADGSYLSPSWLDDYALSRDGYHIARVYKTLEVKEVFLPVYIWDVAVAGGYAVVLHSDCISVVELRNVEPGALTVCNFAARWDVARVLINRKALTESGASSSTPAGPPCAASVLPGNTCWRLR
jgi:hypothetical protein